jgi:hypothetical protein
VHTLIQPLLQPQGIIVKPLGFRNTAIVKSMPGGYLFDQQCMLVQEVQDSSNFMYALTYQ